MYRSNSSRIFPVIILVIVIGALIAGLVTAGRYLFAGSSSNTDEVVTQETKQTELLTIDAERSVRMIIRGPIVANESFRSYQITVSPSSREYVVYKGYLDSVVRQKNYSNNTKAYEEFVYALDKAAFTKEGKNTPEEASDIRGICATGRVYEYQLFDGATRLQYYWTSTCKGSPGTLGASQEQLTDLFAAQIPEEKLDFESFSQLSL